MKDNILRDLSPSPPDVETLRVYIILPLYHEFNNLKQYKLLQKPFASAVLSLREPASKVVASWWSMMNRDYFERLVYMFKNVASYILRHQNIQEGKVSELKIYF